MTDVLHERGVLADDPAEYLTLTRFHPVRHYATHVIDADRLRGVYADVETTGLDSDMDRIIQLALVPFEFSRDGQVCSTEEAFVELEEPGVSISEEVTALTGITAEMVKGKRIDSRKVEEIMGGADLVVCHNASFDRQFMENRFPFLKDKRFACSYRDVPWRELGFATAKLEWLAFKHLGMFYDGHRADTDCYVGIHLLSQPLPGGAHTALEAVLSEVGKQRYRLWACGTPFETRHMLKKRGYTWSDGSKKMPKSWWIDVVKDDYFAEREWLGENVYGHGDTRAIVAVGFDSRQRFSNRIVP
jgi:DNA polymerase-3 subunit epsilon